MEKKKCTLLNKTIFFLEINVFMLITHIFKRIKTNKKNMLTV